MYEMTTLFMLNAKHPPLQFIKLLRKYKAEIDQNNQPKVDPTYALFDPDKR